MGPISNISQKFLCFLIQIIKIYICYILEVCLNLQNYNKGICSIITVFSFKNKKDMNVKVLALICHIAYIKCSQKFSKVHKCTLSSLELLKLCDFTNSRLENCTTLSNNNRTDNYRIVSSPALNSKLSVSHAHFAHFEYFANFAVVINISTLTSKNTTLILPL